MLEYSQSANTLTRKKVLNHPGEIWALVPSTQDPSLFATCYNTGTSVKSTIWRMHGLPDPDAGSGSDDGESEGASDGAGGDAPKVLARARKFVHGLVGGDVQLPGRHP